MNWNDYLESQIADLQAIDVVQVESLTKQLRELRSRGSYLWVGGNGGSSATASHAAADLTKTITQRGEKPLPTIALSEALSLTTASANDIDFEYSLANSLKLMAREGDGVLIISVSGTSPNLIALIHEAKRLGLRTFALVGAAGAEIVNLVDEAIVVRSFDYQIVENSHLFLLHWFVKYLEKEEVN